MEDDPPFIDDVELARRISIARATLQTWRARREGPPFVKVNRRVFYRWTDVVQWLEQYKVHTTPPAPKSAPTTPGPCADRSCTE